MGALVTFMTLNDRIRQMHGVRIQATTATRITRGSEFWDGWDHDRYLVRVTYQGRAMALMYRKGLGHNGTPPSLEEILDSLASDSRGVSDGETFEDWASECGYDTDSRKAEATYRECLKQSKKFRALLGTDELIEEFLYNTEGL